MHRSEGIFRWLKAIPAALAVLAGSCTLTDVTIPAGEDVVAVAAVLRTDAPVQSIILHRSLNGRDVRGVAGASVVVSGDNGRTVTFTEGSEECYRYSSVYFETQPGVVEASCYQSSETEGAWVAPGIAYRLRVETTDGRVIQGRTRVPGRFSLARLPFTRQEAGRVNAVCALAPGRALPVAWTRSDSAWSYVAPLRLFNLRDALAAGGLDTDIPDPLELVGLAISQEDTTIVLPTEFGVFDRFQYDNGALAAIQTGLPDGVLAEMVIAAADRNYVNAIRGGSFNPSGPIRISSVSGDGVGVFGSVVPLYVRVRVMTDAAARRSGVPLCPVP